MKNIYIFNAVNRASVYGVGTYLDQLIESLISCKCSITIVNLFTVDDEIIIEEKIGYKQISIPFLAERDLIIRECYFHRITYILMEFIPTNVQCIFHFNYRVNSSLLLNLKNAFNCKIIITIHYTKWSFSLLGDFNKLKKIMNQPSNIELEKNTKEIIDSLIEDEIVLNLCDFVICVSQHTYKSYHKLLDVKNIPFVVINNAVKDDYKKKSNFNKIQIKNKYKIPLDIKIIFFAGRLDEVKGISFLLESFKNVLKTHSNVHLFLAGDGNFHQWIPQCFPEWFQISFIGKLTKKQLTDFYQISDVGVVCSLHEEFGFVAIEMLMNELPIIVTDTTGLSEIIDDGVNGLKVSIKTINGHRKIDINAFSDRIRFLVDNPCQAKLYAVNGRDKFINKYELSVFKKKMLDLYNYL